jgi:ABC-type lipoprotein export system ATPase subunit
MIEIKNLGGAKVRALDGISLTIGDDEFLAVMGSSGSGKSTLLHMIAGGYADLGERAYREELINRKIRGGVKWQGQ